MLQHKDPDMHGRGDTRGGVGLYPALVFGIAGLTVLGFALIGLGTIRLLSVDGGSVGTGAGVLEPACAGYTCAPLLVPVVIVAGLACVLGASWLARETA